MNNDGRTLTFHYTSTDEYGDKIESTRDVNQPVTYKCGVDQIFEPLNEALTTMVPGEIKSISIENAYGEYNDDLCETIDSIDMTDAQALVVGETVMVHAAEGGFQRVKVLSVDEEHLVLDANHPLAGQTITFEIELIGIDD